MTAFFPTSCLWNELCLCCYGVFVCYLNDPCTWEERSAVDFHLILIHQNQVSRNWRGESNCCAQIRQLGAESLLVAWQPSGKKIDVLPLVPFLAEAEYISVPVPPQTKGSGRQSLARRDCSHPSIVASSFRIRWNGFLFSVLVKAVNLLDFIMSGSK